MLNPFPYLLSFAAFAPMLIRIVVGLYLLIYAYRLLGRDRVRATEEVARVIKSLAAPWITFLGILEIAAAASLIAGFYTQIGAIVGGLIFLKLSLRAKNYPALSPKGGSLPFLLSILCLTLLITGAGAFAFDYPF